MSIDYAALYADDPNPNLHFVKEKAVWPDGTAKTRVKKGGDGVEREEYEVWTALPAEIDAVENSFNTLVALRVTKSADDTRFNQRKFVDVLGFGVAARIRAGLDAAVEQKVGGLGSWVTGLLDSEEGIDIADVHVTQVLDALVNAGVLQADDVKAVDALKTEIVLKYPNLKRGHVQTARRMKRDGLI